MSGSEFNAAAQKPRKSAPLSIRLTPSERDRLVHMAGNQPVSTFVKSILFDGTGQVRKQPRAPSIEHKMLGHVLSKLGSSQIGTNLALLADDAKTGNLIDDDVTKAQIATACADIRAMRDMLIGALGKRPGDQR